MTAVADALAKIQQIHDNQQALADPAAMLWQAQLQWMSTVTLALAAAAVPVSADAEANTLIAQLQQENADLQAKVAAGEKAVEAFESILHPDGTDAAPSSTEPAAPAAAEPAAAPVAAEAAAPTIQPSNGNV